MDIGPGAGEHGGELVAQRNGTGDHESRTVDHRCIFKRKDQDSGSGTRAEPTGWMKVVGAAENNLKNIDVKFPLGVMTCVTGVSGSGKSSLVNEILYKSMAKKLNRARDDSGKA